jgi:SAM-dependent methyltransferase
VDLVAFDRTRAQTKSVESWQSEGEMSDATRAYLGSWPEFYDRLLVPVLFEPYARLLAGRLQGVTSGNVLEIAAGTGVVTRELIRTLPEAVGITATDLNQPMLDRAILCWCGTRPVAAG